MKMVRAGTASPRYINGKGISISQKIAKKLARLHGVFLQKFEKFVLFDLFDFSPWENVILYLV
jgi:hypothetical protein